jgi:hypothetical protein
MFDEKRNRLISKRFYESRFYFREKKLSGLIKTNEILRQNIITITDFFEE